MKPPEPLLSRLYVILGVLMSVMMSAGLAARNDTLLFVATTLGIITVAGGRILQFLPGNRRRESFTVARGAFLAYPAASPGLATVLSLMTVGVFWALLGPQLMTGGPLALLGLVLLVLVTLLVAWQAILAWDARYVGLTPRGVVWRSVVHRRLVPWDALVPGGIPAASLFAGRITLAVARPDAVSEKGLTLFSGLVARPVIAAAQLDVHPRLLAAAIRWYAEHPADRPAIGTDAEHARLIAALPPIK